MSSVTGGLILARGLRIRTRGWHCSKHGKYCLHNSPGSHLCGFIRRFPKFILPRAKYVILLGHAQDTENYILLKLDWIRDRSAKRHLIMNSPQFWVDSFLRRATQCGNQCRLCSCLCVKRCHLRVPCPKTGPRSLMWAYERPIWDMKVRMPSIKGA